MKDRHRTGSATEDVLAKHHCVWDPDISDAGPVECSCGYVVEGRDEERHADHDAHVASALAVAGVLR